MQVHSAEILLSENVGIVAVSLCMEPNTALGAAQKFIHSKTNFAVIAASPSTQLLLFVPIAVIRFKQNKGEYIYVLRKMRL